MTEPNDDDLCLTLPEQEVKGVLNAILNEYGYAFHGYQQVFVRRRLRVIMSLTQISTLAELARRIGADHALQPIVMDALSVSVTEMFRDPELFRALREQVIPVLATYPFARIWVAGCASGEEAFSLSILLSEEGMQGKFQIYATDLHERALTRARAGILSVAAMQTNTRNYHESGGTSDFSQYYTAGHGMAILGSEWRSPILFSRHDLAHGGSFNEFQLVMCRNVMIYFDKDLRVHVHNLLHGSLATFGFLVLGQKEAIRFSSHDADYVTVDATRRIYKKRR